MSQQENFCETAPLGIVDCPLSGVDESEGVLEEERISQARRVLSGQRRAVRTQPPKEGNRMPQQVLSRHEVSQVLAGEMIVRVAFSDREFPYVIPFGYVYVDPVLYGITAPGRKTRVAERNPHVGFQVDSSSRTGPWEWRSVTGEGRFEMVESPNESEKALAALEPLISGAPGWWQDEIRPLVAKDIVKVWRITPHSVEGIKYGSTGS